MFSNEILFLFQIILVTSLGAIFASKGIHWLTGWLSLLSVIMNIFVLKQVHLFGLEVTAADVYMIGMLIAINYARELYGQSVVGSAIKGAWGIALSFVLVTQLHLALAPSAYDVSQEHFLALFSPSLRLFAASLVTMGIVQVVDLRLFGILRALFKGRAFGSRSGLSMMCSQVLDSVLFSFLGLYGVVANVWHVIAFALLAKTLVLCLSMPCIFVMKYFTGIEGKQEV